MSILWESPRNSPGLVQYGLNGKLNRQTPPAMPRELLVVSTNSVTNIVSASEKKVKRTAVTNAFYLHEITLTNLRSHAVYTYAAETEGVRSAPKKFTTFGSHPYKVTFIAYGDTRTNPKIHASITQNFKRYAPDFILHTGDLVTNGKRHEQWGREFFGPLARVIDEVPILPAIGNHEEDGINYLHYLHLPGTERWYSYDVGPVHVLSLDYRYEKAADEQFWFAKRDLLSAKAPWKVVILHYPVFNIGGHNTGWGHTAYLPLFHQTKVDLVVAGHSHIYERFRPVASKGPADTWPITHITTGGGGAPLYGTFTHPALAARAATNHFVVIEATPTTLNGRAITTNNVVLDTFELKKYGGRPPARLYAQVYPEEALKLSFDAIGSLTAGLASVPATNAAAKAMFNLRQLKSARQPMELEISLTPDSAAFYEIEGGPLRILSPSATVSNRIAWANVRATGKKKVVATGQSKELSPALVFQARILAEKAETMAYGQKCRVTTNAVAAVKKLAEAQTSQPSQR